MNYQLALKNKIEHKETDNIKKCKYFFIAEIDYDITNGHSTIGKFCKKYQKQVYNCNNCNKGELNVNS